MISLSQPNKIYSAAYLLVTLALTACAKSNTPAQPASSSAQPLLAVQKTASFQEALEIASAARLTCTEGTACAPAIGLYLAADKPGGFANSDSVGACTLVLVGEDLALTNSHCIPAAVKNLPDLCPERIRATFPKSGELPEETFTCKELLGFSERANAISPDLALIRLDHKARRAPLKTSRAGVENAEPLLSVKVNPDLKNLSGTQVQERCVSATSSYRMPLYRVASDPTLVLGDCTAIGGNSGSALIGKDGRLVALMQANLTITDANRAEWGRHLEERGEIAKLALATSLGCLAADPEEWKWNPACVTIEEQEVALARPRIRQFLTSEALRQSLTRLLLPFGGQSALVRLQAREVETRTLTRTEALLPRCAASIDEWRSEFLESETSEQLKEEAELALALPVYSLELRFNRFLQARPPAAMLSETKRLTYKIRPREIEAGIGSAVLVPADGSAPFTLPPCSIKP